MHSLINRMSKRKECEGCLNGTPSRALLEKRCQNVENATDASWALRKFLPCLHVAFMCCNSFVNLLFKQISKLFVPPAHIAESSPWDGVSSSFNIVKSHLFARNPFTKYDFRICALVFRKPLCKEAPYKIRLSG